MIIEPKYRVIDEGILGGGHKSFISRGGVARYCLAVSDVAEHDMKNLRPLQKYHSLLYACFALQ